MIFPRAVSFALVSLAAAFVIACGGDDSNTVRGRGLALATLPASDQAHVYEAAVRAAFDVDDPALSLLLDARELPRGVGLAAATRLPDSIVAELRRRGVTKGTCEPALDAKRGVPRCSAARPGYIVRFSPVFALRGDSVQVYVYAQKYDTPSSGASDRLRFERAYQVVRRGDDWRAVREGRVPKEIRGETR
jgi:hypothetical protein